MVDRWNQKEGFRAKLFEITGAQRYIVPGQTVSAVLDSRRDAKRLIGQACGNLPEAQNNLNH
jgi:hypothetical protein